MARTVTVPFVLVALALAVGATAEGRHAAPPPDEIKKITEKNIHELYALDIVREHTMNVPAEKVQEYCVAAGNVVVNAPDPSEGHPNLFFMTAKRYQIMEKGQMVNPQLTVIALKDAISVSYRQPKAVPKADRNKVLYFCNHWNENYRVATCYVDEKGYATLHSDIKTLASPNEQSDHMVDSFNHILLDRGLYDFQVAVQRFSKDYVNKILLLEEVKAEL